jgi:hypothetical protein
MTKLSPRMQEVLTLMGHGWQLGLDVTMSGRPWLQKGGLSKGGPSKDVLRGTFDALRSRGLIELAKNGFPTQAYRLAKEPAPPPSSGP